MLKRNLIAIVMLGLVMTINAFGQDDVRGKRPSKTNPEIKRSDAIVKPKSANVNEITIDGTTVWGNEVEITGGRRGSSSETSRRNQSQNNWFDGSFDLGGRISSAQKSNNNSSVEIEGVAPRKPNSIKSPRDVATGQATEKRQHKPVKANLGDTGTHEVGHKQRKRGNN